MTQVSERDEARIQARQARVDTNVFARLASIYAASRKQAQRLLQGCGDLSIVEWRTLWDLHEAGPMTITDLASTQRADHSLLSRALPQMQRKGLVTMRRASQDGRQMIVTLTEAGQQAYNQAAPVMAHRRATLRDTFTEDEIADLVGYLDRLESFVHRPASDIAPKEFPE